MTTRVGRVAWLAANWPKVVVVLAGFCILFVVKGTVATYGVFITPIESEFGWSRTTISLTFTIYLLATAVSSPIAGNLIDRYGAFRTLPVFILLVAVPLVALSQLSSVVHLYGAYVVIGLAVTGLGLGHFSSVVTKVFESRALLASGIAISGFSVGQLVFNPVAAELILSHDWRTAYFVFGALSVAVIPLAYFGLRPAAADAPARPRRTDVGQQRSGAAVEIPIRTALSSWSLWLLVVTFFICGFTTTGLITTHLVPHLESVGFTGRLAAQGQGMLGGMTVFGLLAMGVVGDRYSSMKRHLLASIYFLRGVTLLFLLVVTTVVELLVFASVYGFLTLCTVPLHAGITADRFGSTHLTTLVGLQYMGHQIGAATAALVAAVIFDTTGGYQWAHLLGVGLLMIAPVLVIVDRSGRPVSG